MKARLDHIGVFVADLERSRAFYERFLGMEFVDRDEDDSFLMMTLRDQDHEVHLFQAKASTETPQFNHVARHVSPAELDRIMQDLRFQNVAFSGPHSYRETKFIKVKDPDGLVWEWISGSEDES